MKRSLLDEWLSALIRDGSQKVRERVVYKLYAIFNRFKRVEVPFRLLLQAVKESRRLEGICRDVAFTVRALKDRVETVPGRILNELKSTILSRLSVVSCVDHDAEVLLSFAADDLHAICEFIEHRLRRTRRSGSKREFEAIPRSGLGCIKNHLRCYEDYEVLMDKAIGWKLRYSRSSEDILNLILPLSSLPTSKAPEEQPWIHIYIEDRLCKGNIAAAIATAHYVPLEENTTDLLMAVVEKGLSCGMRKEIDQLLNYHARPPSACFLGPDGSPELVEKRRLFRQMANRCPPGLLRTMLESQAEALQTHNEIFIRHYEERLGPRA